MDPNAALAQIREALDEPEWDSSTIEYVASAFQGLDVWLANGGFLPDSWAKGR